MKTPDQHPDTELLDRLRAGLLDDRPQQKAELEQHIQDCPQCRQLFAWPEQLRPVPQDADALQRRLDQARRQALDSASGSRRRHHWAPAAAAAAVALVAVLLTNPLGQNGPEDTQQLASTSPTEVPEVYEDLDFYLWLSEHKAAEDSAT